MDVMNAYIPAHSKSDPFMRILSLDCSESELKLGDFWNLMDRLNPDLAVFIKFPRNPVDQETLDRILVGREYVTRMAFGEYWVISRFPVESIEKLPVLQDGNSAVISNSAKVYAAELVVRMEGQRMHVLPMALNKLDKTGRMAETMELLIRAGAIMSAAKSAPKSHFILLGSTGTPKVTDEAYEKFEACPLFDDSFSACSWPAPRFTDSFQRPMDHHFLSYSLADGVLGSYVYYWDAAPHLPIITDIQRRILISGGIDGGYSAKYMWDGFKTDMFKVLMYWVPLVAIGAAVVLILGFWIRRQEDSKAIPSGAHDQLSGGRPFEDDSTAGWDVIQVADHPHDPPKKERMASYDPSVHPSLPPSSSQHSSGVSSVMPPAVVHIQTPPQFPPPPYSSVTDDKGPHS